MLNLSAEQAAGLTERLRNERIAWITTVTPGGQPQSSPIWFLWDSGTGEFLVFAQPRSWKVRNIRANPLVSLNLNSDDHGGKVATFEGSANIDEGYPLAHQVPAYLAKYSDAITGIGMTPEQMAQVYAIPLLITPARVRVF